MPKEGYRILYRQSTGKMSTPLTQNPTVTDFQGIVHPPSPSRLRPTRTLCGEGHCPYTPRSDVMSSRSRQTYPGKRDQGTGRDQDWEPPTSKAGTDKEEGVDFLVGLFPHMHFPDRYVCHVSHRVTLV